MPQWVHGNRFGRNVPIAHDAQSEHEPPSCFPIEAGEPDADAQLIELLVVIRDV